MKPVIALVGRPNVGKSTLFNQFTRTRDAIVADVAGLTRDRQYGQGQFDDRQFIVIDTGGIGENLDGIDQPMTTQAKQAMEEADILLFMVDGKAGLTSADESIARQLRTLQKPVELVVNKTDGLDENVALADFYQLGFERLHAIAAAHKRGIRQLLDKILPPMEADGEDVEEEDDDSIKVAIIGRPNVGKSTLLNRMLGEERVVVYDMAGTTRDVVRVPFERFGVPYTLIDTAGLRRRGKVFEAVEKFSAIKALQAIDKTQIVLLVIDGTEGITEQDMHLLGYALRAGRSLVIAVNKWDGLEADHKNAVKRELDRRLDFIPWARVHTISALHGTGVGALFDFIEKAHESAFIDLGSNKLTKLLERFTFEHQPPQSGRFRAKLRYAHQGGSNPPLIVVHGKRLTKLPGSYVRYLENRYRDALRLEGTPVQFEFKQSDNPYADRKNPLTERQKKKRKRLRKHLRK